jgi:hypothetical protein
MHLDGDSRQGALLDHRPGRLSPPAPEARFLGRLDPAGCALARRSAQEEVHPDNAKRFAGDFIDDLPSLFSEPERGRLRMNQ